MDNSTLSIALTGVVPAVCDAEAGVKLRIKPTMYPATGSGSGNGSVSKIRSVMAELCCAIRSALDDERSTAEDSLRRAAEIQGRSVSDFVVAAAQEAAQRTISEIEVLRLSGEAKEQFISLLLNPPHPNAALGRAFKRHRASIETK
jgi:uncharacterized protein (DUF1778 family)